MAKQAYEPCPKGYKRVTLIVHRDSQRINCVFDSSNTISPFPDEYIVPIDIPLSALKPAKVKK